MVVKSSLVVRRKQSTQLTVRSLAYPVLQLQVHADCCRTPLPLQSGGGGRTQLVFLVDLKASGGSNPRTILKLPSAAGLMVAFLLLLASILA